jgi:hypothetical protein
MALDPVLNFAKVTVSTGYDDSATSVVLSSGGGAKLPQPSTDGAFNLVWWNSTDYADPSDDPNREIVRCTARSTDTLTVTRAQESIAATTKNTGGKTYSMILALTAKMISDIVSNFFSPLNYGTTAWGAGSPFTWTMNSDSTNKPTIAFGNGTVTFTAIGVTYSFSNSASQLQINQTSSSGTEWVSGNPTGLIWINDDRTGTTVNEKEESSLVIDVAQTGIGYGFWNKGKTYLSGDLSIVENILMVAGAQIQFGNAGSAIRDLATDGVHIGIFGSSAGYSNRNIIICDADFINYNFDHSTQSSNPTVFIHSVTDPDTDNTQWLSLTHDQTNGVITTGKGNISLVPAGAGVTLPTGKNLTLGTTQWNSGDSIDGTKLASMTSAQLAAILSDESGTDKVAFTTSPVFTTPNIGVATATSVNFAVASGAGTYTGNTLTVTSTETQAIGDAVKIDSNGKAHLAKADAIANASAVLLAATAVTNSAANTYLLPGGTLKLSSSPSWTVGGLIYLSTTGTTTNTLTQTAPTGTNNVIQVLGVAIAADTILFQPSLLQVEHT